jgi:hypothetical protein
MPESAFIAEQDFQTVRQNRSGYAVAEASSYSQQVSFQSQAAYGEPLMAVSLHRAMIAPVLTEMQLQNRSPGVTGEKRAKFKKRTFPGKPLSDDETVQATQIASELEDAITLRRLSER